MWERLVGSAFFELNFSLLPQGFVVRALMPQEWTQSPKHSVFLNNLMSLINCESLKEIGEMACVTPARSSRGQTYRSSFQGTISYFSFRTQWLANDTAPPTFFYVLWIELFEENPKKFHFHQPWLVLALLLPIRYGRKFPALSAFVLVVGQIVFFQCYSTPVLLRWSTLLWDGRFSFLNRNVRKIWQTAVVIL